MGRKNSRVKRANDRGRRARQAEALMPKVRENARVRPEDLVLPDGKCYSTSRRGKARFDTKEKADKALRQAQRQRARMGSGHVEKRVYPCPDGGCGGFHLSSRETYTERGAS